MDSQRHSTPNESLLHDDQLDDDMALDRPRVSYICGGKRFAWVTEEGCGKTNALDKETIIRCISCGHRIFYKQRERKLLQYEAR